MLTLSRQEGQCLVLNGGEVVVWVECARSGRVRLNIEAPRSIEVMRGELVGATRRPPGRGDGGGDRRETPRTPPPPRRGPVADRLGDGPLDAIAEAEDESHA